MNYPAASCGVSKAQYAKDSESRHPRMFLSGVQIWIRLDSRLKHAGMTDFDLAICFTQQAAGNEPSAIQFAIWWTRIFFAASIPKENWSAPTLSVIMPSDGATSMT
jgi:hypothetical protein